MFWKEKAGVLFMVQALCGHPISSIDRYFLHDDEVTLHDGHWVTGLADGRYGGDGEGNTVEIYTRLGAVPETAYARAVDVFGADDIYTNDHRGDGQASLLLVARSVNAKILQTIYPNGAPSLDGRPRQGEARL